YLLYHPQIEPLSEQQRRTGVAQIMESLVRQPRCLEHAGKVTIDVPRLERSAERRSKDQVVVGPEVRRSIALAILTLAVEHKRTRRHERQRDRPAAFPRLDVRELQFAAGAVQSSTDANRALSEIYV